MSESIADRLAAAGIALPAAPKPLAAYIGFVEHNGIVTISGQLPMVDGALSQTGLLGDSCSIEQGVAAAQVCAINILSQVSAACDGDLERIVRCIRLGGFVASTPSFTDQPKVINGASEFMAQILEERGAHSRAAVGVAALPMNASVEIEATFAIR